VVIADRLAMFVDAVYQNPNGYHGFQIILASIFYAFQIYCDFSGYSDIALGSAEVMGFRLMKNFNDPFVSKSVTEFWRRWHISLSTWFTDYLFTPFVINNRNWGKAAVVLGILLTFSISGLWHGANWTFIIWGLLHGCAMAYEFLTQRFIKKQFRQMPGVIYNVTSRIFTFTFLIFVWIFFRAANIEQAFTIIKNGLQFSKAQLGLFILGPNTYDFLLGIVFILALETIQALKRKTDISSLLNRQNAAVRWAVYFIFVLILINFGVYGRNQFIYFQF
jgi:alginate O-acetyltransferase complex protein AlgI